MANLDDIVTVQKNGVIAVNALVQELSTFRKVYQNIIGSVAIGGINNNILAYTGTGRIVGISVIVAASGGTIHDSSTVNGASNANAVLAIPATIGFYPVNFVVNDGIVVKPASGSTVGIVYSES